MVPVRRYHYFKYYNKSGILELYNVFYELIERHCVSKEEWEANAKGKSDNSVLLWLNNKYGN